MNTETPGGYVTAFRGRRDNYQAPVAIAEAGRLDAFLTDAWANAGIRKLASALPTRKAEAVIGRFDPRIPESKVRCLWSTTSMERAQLMMGADPTKTYERADRFYSECAAKAARATRANLFLYSSYASQAFKQDYAHAPRRILFQYHPHAQSEARVLKEDAVKYADILGPPSATAQTSAAFAPDDAWQFADQIICASSFTRATLLEHGANSDKVVLAPYGVDARIERPAPAGEAFRALFVGSGVQRKGLHHLLLAWRQASLPANAALKLICRTLDPAIAALAASIEGVSISQGVTASELSNAYAEASLFVMPSLVEGFGQVYLEALSHGLPVLGTRHTCLPDIGNEVDGVFIIDVGAIDELAAMLRRLSQKLPGNDRVRAAAHARAQQFTWSAFRQKLIAVL